MVPARAIKSEHGPLAQRLEQRTHNPLVEGSNPSGPTTHNFMSETADVVIAGGGIVGSSIAYHLTEAGCKNVIVLERESHQGKGSTGKSMGGVRAQFTTPVNIQMSLYSIPFYANFEERLNHPSGYRAQ